MWQAPQEQQQQQEQSNLVNIYDSLDFIHNWLLEGKGELTPDIFWSLISMEVPIETSLTTNISNGFGIIEYKINTVLYDQVNKKANIMDWRATDYLYQQYLLELRKSNPNAEDINFHRNNIRQQLQVDDFRTLSRDDWDRTTVRFPDGIRETRKQRWDKLTNQLFTRYKQAHNKAKKKYIEILTFAFNRPEFAKFLESEDAVKANIKVKNLWTGEESLYRNVVRSFPNYHSYNGRFPGYLYHYKKMNFLLKTIADCNYVAFDLILDKLDITNKKHKDLLMGYINLKHNTVEKRAFGGGRERVWEVRSKLGTTGFPDRLEYRPDWRANLETGPFKMNDDSPERMLLFDVRERSGLRQRQNDKEKKRITDKRKSDIIGKGEWKIPWLFEKTTGDRSGDIGELMPFAYKKYILTYIFQHCYELNDRRYFEKYNSFKLKYAQDYYGDKPEFGPTDSPYFEASHYGKFRDPSYRYPVSSYGFKMEQVFGGDFFRATIEVQQSACERYMDWYVPNIERAGQKFLKKFNLANTAMLSALGYWQSKEKNENNRLVEMLNDSTHFFLANIDKERLTTGSTGNKTDGLAHISTVFGSENLDSDNYGKRAWLWWKENDLTEKDRPTSVHADQAHLAEILGSPGYSGYNGQTTLFGGDPYNLNHTNQFQQDKYITMISILLFKKTYNSIFKDEIAQQKRLNPLLMTTSIVRNREEKARVPTSDSKGKQVMMAPKIGTNIASFMGGKRRKNKRKSKRTKRMTKRTRRKRGGVIINKPDDLMPGNNYKIKIDDEEIVAKYLRENSAVMGVTKYIFEGDPAPIHFGKITEPKDGWLEGTYDEDGQQDSDDIQVVPIEGFFIIDLANSYYDEGYLTPGRKKITIESVETGGRRRRRKRKTKRKKNKKRRKRKRTKKKRRKR